MENDIINHPFFMVGYGSFLYFVALFTITKSRNEARFKSQKWLQENWDDFLLTLVVGAALVIWDDELLQAYNDYKGTKHPLEMKPYFYLLPGPITDLIIRIIKQIRNGHS